MLYTTGLPLIVQKTNMTGLQEIIKQNINFGVRPEKDEISTVIKQYISYYKNTNGNSCYLGGNSCHKLGHPTNTQYIGILHARSRITYSLLFAHARHKDLFDDRLHAAGSLT